MSVTPLRGLALGIALPDDGNFEGEQMGFPNWEDCTPEQKRQRRVNFGGAPSVSIRAETYQEELIRRFQSGVSLSRADRREARRLLQTKRA